jgi:nicotinate-nucleotide adenylyltransferase
VRFGLFGGTFDPPHAGHLIVAQDAALALGLDRILFVPAAVPPHKQSTSITPAPLRLRMLELALADDGRFGVDPVELQRQGPSYTVDTLRHLTARTPGEWTLLIGADQYLEFGTWHDTDAIRTMAAIAVLDRAGLTPGDPHADGALPGTARLPDGARRVAVTRIDISATAIRARVAAGLPIRYLVPAVVERFIVEHGLYARNGAEAVG